MYITAVGRGIYTAVFAEICLLAELISLSILYQVVKGVRRTTLEREDMAVESTRDAEVR